MLFLRLLLSECEREEVACQHQYIRREDDASGLCSAELPWLAMPVKERIGKLRALWKNAEKTARATGAEAYEREARDTYGSLREAWEQAVPEVLLNDVVERYRPSIETKKLRYLHDITEEDCVAVDEGMSECSRWMRGHDHPAADGTPFPKPDELLRRIDMSLTSGTNGSGSGEKVRRRDDHRPGNGLPSQASH